MERAQGVECVDLQQSGEELFFELAEVVQAVWRTRAGEEDVGRADALLVQRADRLVTLRPPRQWPRKAAGLSSSGPISGRSVVQQLGQRADGRFVNAGGAAGRFEGDDFDGGVEQVRVRAVGGGAAAGEVEAEEAAAGGGARLGLSQPALRTAGAGVRLGPAARWRVCESSARVGLWSNVVSGIRRPRVIPGGWRG